MVRTRGALVLGALLAVSGCTSPPTAPTGTPLTSTAEAADSGPEPTGAEPTGPEPTAPAPTAPAVDGARTNDAGDVVKELGEPAELISASSGEPYFGLTVVSIAVRPTCPGEFAQPPNGGQFVVVEVSTWLADDIADVAVGDADGDDPLVFTGPDQFSIVAPTGDVHGDLGSDAAWTCFATQERLSYTIAPGEQHHGLVVLDSPVGHGTLRYSPDGGPGWEWTF